MNLGRGAEKFTINGGNFTNVEGDYTEFNDYTSGVTNIDSNNMYGNKVTGSFNNNSKTFRNSRSRPVQDDEDDDMYFTPADNRREAHTRSQHDGPNMSGNSDENESDSDDSDSSSLQEGTRMADSSFRGSMPSSTSRGKSHSQTTNPSPFSRPTFRPYSTPPYTSRPNPSVPPNIKKPAQANRFAQSTTFQQYDIHEDNNPNRPPPVPPSHLPPRSSGGPQFRNNPGNFSKRDTTNVYETNISSFNTNNNTIQNSFNDNSLVDSSGNRKRRTKKPEGSRRS